MRAVWVGGTAGARARKNATCCGVAFAGVTILAVPLVLLASDVAGFGPLGQLWLTLGLQLLAFPIAIFWKPQAGAAHAQRPRRP